jgi:hypothetical protein
MPDEFPVNSPEWWVRRLDRRLRAQTPEVQRLQRYYDGEHRLRFATEKFRQAFGGLFGNLADNWTAIVVDAVAERLKVNGFRIGEDSQGDRLFWEIWQRNAMDAESKVGFVDSLIAGRAFVTVWSEPDNPGTAELTVESSEQVVIDVDPASRRRRRAAWKVYRDDYSEHLFGVLYKPEGVFKFQSFSPVQEGRSVSSDTTKWVRREVRGETWPLPNPLEVVPVVPLSNRRRLLRSAQSEIANTIPLQDVCNKLLADLVVTSEFQSFRQRWVTGIDIPEDPETGQPLEPFKSAVDRLFLAESKDARFGEFSETNLAGYVSSIELAVQHIASQSRTPPHYFYLKGNLPSGESIKSAETGLVAKSRDKMMFLGEELEEIASLAFLVEGEEGKAEAARSGETIWGDPEYRTEGEHVDAVLKKKGLGVPEEILWEELGYTQTEIARIKAIKWANALELASAAVTIGRPPVIGPPVPGEPQGNGNGAVPQPVGAPTA